MVVTMMMTLDLTLTPAWRAEAPVHSEHVAVRSTTGAVAVRALPRIHADRIQSMYHNGCPRMQTLKKLCKDFSTAFAPR